MTNKVIKRGYYKWIDESGKRHKEKVGAASAEPEMPLFDGVEDDEGDQPTGDE